MQLLRSPLVSSIPFVTAAALGAALPWLGCGSSSSNATAVLAPSASASGETCPACVTDSDCSGGVCAQLGGDSYCAPSCPTGNECAADRACVAVSTVSGDQVSVCAPRSDVCSAPSPDDAAAPSDHCGALVGPSVTASCTSCKGKSDCQTNGCYGGWWCNTASSKCQAPPSDCGGTTGGPVDAGATPTGTIDESGGTLSRLVFGVVGDTRPAVDDDTAAYPRAVIEQIYTTLEGFTPKPPFIVSTGDYMFARANGSQADPQLDIYLAARAKYSGVLFPALGNHECTGGTASNCGAGNPDGVTRNFTSFMTKMLGPIHKTAPYYAVEVAASDHTWTAKLVFIAANAWDDTQSNWLDGALARPTTYTFVIRHESHSANTAPGVTPSEAIMARHPYTLAIVGHTHTYEHFHGSKEVVIGNGGAPLTGSKDYGFAMLNQRADGAIQVDMIHYQSGAADTGFRFAVNPDGSAAP